MSGSPHRTPRSRGTPVARLRSPSSTARETDAADMDLESEQIEVPESSDYDSPRPSTPLHRAVRGVCARCGGVVGNFFNAWVKITGSYYLPALLGSYSSLLTTQGRRKTASIGTELDGCTIQPLACPACAQTLAFHVVDAPAEKPTFRGRDFFKLSKIQLQCEEAPGTFVQVDPECTDLDVLTVDHSSEPESEQEQTLTMEVESRPAPHLSGPMHHYKQHQQRDLHSHQPLQQVEANRQTLPPPIRSPPTPLLSNGPQKSPNNPTLPSPAVQPVNTAREAHPVLPPPREIIASPAHHARELPPPIVSHHQSPVEPQGKDQGYPRSPNDVKMDAIDRLQTQVLQNSSVLATQSRDIRRFEEAIQHKEEAIRREFQTQVHHQNLEIRRVDEAVGSLQHEMRSIRELLEVLGREFQASGGVHGRPSGPSVQDSALELMAQQIAVISAKANDVETLKITIEIMKNKIQRLENNAVASPAQPAARAYASPREPATRSLPSQHTVPSHHGTPSLPSHPNPAVPSNPHGRSALGTPESSQRVENPSEPRPTPTGWATVNAGMKRTLSGGLHSPHDSVGPSPESPKRPKLAPIEPRAAYAGPQAPAYEHMDTDDSDAARVQTHRHTLPSQSQSTMSIPDSTLPSQHPHPSMVAYATQDAPPDDSWRPESQRMVQVRTPRGRGSRGGPGSRGGRVRKSMTTPGHPISTPEWERVDWQGVPESQVSPDGYYTVVRTNRPIVRRGSGGGGAGSRGGRPSSAGRGSSVSLGMQGVTPGASIGLPADPYAHTKKTRTKPVRNADGVLIRKDGRPDMRSQSSAANLRKVHSRTGGSENPESQEREFTPSQQHTPNGSAEASTAGGSPSRQDVAPSVRKKHDNIMSKIFPNGVEESRKDLDLAHKVFDEDENHAAQPRSQLHHQHHQAGGRPLEIKREHHEERRYASTQSPGSDDVDMDRPEDHADDEGQTPGEQSDNSGHESQYHERHHQVQQSADSRPLSASNSAHPAVESSTAQPTSSTPTIAASSGQEA